MNQNYKEHIVSPCNFRLIDIAAIKDVNNDDIVEFDKDDVAVLLRKVDFPYDEQTLNDESFRKEANRILNSSEFEDFDRKNPKHMELLRKLGKEQPRIQAILKKAMSYYYTRSVRPKTVLPFSGPKTKASMALVKTGSVPGYEIFNSSTGKKGWISFVDLELLWKDAGKI